MDFTKFELSNKQYGGSERKIGLTDGSDFYMIKFRKKSDFGLKYNHVSEFIGSHIFELLGFNTHKTALGYYKNEEVVACKDFNENGCQFVPFNDVGESSIEMDKEVYQYSYEDIVSMLKANKKLTNVEETVNLFFETYIVDALIGNFDRHGGNWGFLKRDNKYFLAPIFDNGSCLYPSLIDEEEIKRIISDENEINERVYTFPTSQIQLNNKKSSYFDVISSLKFEGINNALKTVYQRIDLGKINLLIDNTSFISETRKEFYKLMIKERYNKIIKYSYDLLMRKENE